MILPGVRRWIRISGWLGIFVAYIILQMYNYTHQPMFIVSLVIVILYSAYILATSAEPSWYITSIMLRRIIICICLVSIIQGVFLCIAYYKLKKSRTIK